MWPVPYIAQHDLVTFPKVKQSSQLNLFSLLYCYLSTQVKAKFQDVFNQVATHLTLRETEYFGLAFKKGKLLSHDQVIVLILK